MTTAADFLNALRAYEGSVEQPLGSNHVPGITDRYGFDGAWCDMLISVAAEDCALPHTPSAWVGYEADRAAAGENGYQVISPDDLQAGDLICHDFPGGVKLDHIDTVEVRNGDTLYCIDGNWGDRWARVIRHVGDASIQNGVCIRPPFTDAPAPPAPQPSEPPAGGNPNPYCPLGVDGAFTNQTCAALQWSLNDSHIADKDGNSPIDVDGEFGPSTASSLQRYLGVKVDGQFGPASTKALQSHVGAGVDGALGPDTISHLQTALNNQTF